MTVPVVPPVTRLRDEGEVVTEQGTGVGVGVDVGIGAAVGVGVRVGAMVGVAVGNGVTVGVGVGVGQLSDKQLHQYHGVPVPGQSLVPA